MDEARDEAGHPLDGATSSAPDGRGAEAAGRAAPYTALARVYDAIMEDIDYADWFAFLERRAQARRVGRPLRRLLDLGCGTGNATAPALERGYEVVGLDGSPAMLEVARAKFPGARFVEGRFDAFRLDARFDLVYSVFDALNNLLTLDDFVAALVNVRRHLVSGGVLAFDVNTTVGLAELWESDRVRGWAGEVYYDWRHSFDAERGLARVDAHCETPTTSFTETHYERPYDPDEVRTALGGAGYRDIEIVEYPGGEPAPPDAPRIWVFATRS